MSEVDMGERAIERIDMRTGETRMIVDRLTRLKSGTKYVWIGALPVPIDALDVKVQKSKPDSLEMIRLNGRLLSVQTR